MLQAQMSLFNVYKKTLKLKYGRVGITRVNSWKCSHILKVLVFLPMRRRRKNLNGYKKGNNKKQRGGTAVACNLEHI